MRVFLCSRYECRLEYVLKLWLRAECCADGAERDVAALHAQCRLCHVDLLGAGPGGTDHADTHAHHQPRAQRAYALARNVLRVTVAVLGGQRAPPVGQRRLQQKAHAGAEVVLAVLPAPLIARLAPEEVQAQRLRDGAANKQGEGSRQVDVLYNGRPGQLLRPVIICRAQRNEDEPEWDDDEPRAREDVRADISHRARAAPGIVVAPAVPAWILAAAAQRGDPAEDVDMAPRAVRPTVRERAHVNAGIAALGVICNHKLS